MLTPGRLLRRLRNLLSRGRRDSELNEELRVHLEMETEKHMQTGMSREAARARAERDFGGVARFRDATRDTHGVRAFEDFVQDIRVGVRGLLRQRTFAAVAILTLVVGIGGTTAVFGAVYGVLLAPLPFRDQDRVVTLWQTDATEGVTRGEVSVPNFIDWRERSRSFSHIATAEPYSLDYIGPDGPEVFQNAVVTEGFFEALGVTPILGRTFTPDEYTAGRNQVLVLSESLWRTRFGSDSTLIGRTLTLDRGPLVVVGILPRTVNIPWDVTVWTPKIFRPDELQARGSDYFTAFARLRDGVTLEAAQREMDGIAAELAKAHPATNKTSGVAVVPIAEAMVGSSRKGLLIILGAVGFVLLIACVNVASLQLGQAVRRRREFATRATLGAGTWRLARQLFAECLILAATGGALGMVVAYWGLAAIRALAPADLPRVEQLQLQPAVLWFALGVSVLTAFLFGLAPVLEARRLPLAEVIQSGARSTSGSRARRRTQHALVVAEVALALVLLVGAGLLVRSFRTLLTVDRGFDSRNVLVATLQAWSYYQTPAERVAFARDAVERFRGLPGVQSAGTTSAMPLSGPIGAEGATMSIEGQPPPTEGKLPTIHVEAVTAGYFDALRIKLRAGRYLTDADRDSSPAVVVNEAFVRRYWPTTSPIGKRLGFGFQRRATIHEVVGVVADVRNRGLDRAAEPSVFLPHAMAPTGAFHFVIRTTGDPRALDRPVRQTLAAMNGSMPVSEMRTGDELLSASVHDRRFFLALIGAFSLTAMLLAAIGIYGVLSHMTSERTQEIGVRVAMGATTGEVLGMVLRQGALLAAGGIAIGLAGAVALTRLLRGMLFQITPLDPATFGIALVALFSAALVACWIPARRAAAVDPMKALRD